MGAGVNKIRTRSPTSPSAGQKAPAHPHLHLRLLAPETHAWCLSLQPVGLCDEPRKQRRDLLTTDAPGPLISGAQAGRGGRAACENPPASGFLQLLSCFPSLSPSPHLITGIACCFSFCHLH